MLFHSERVFAVGEQISIAFRIGNVENRGTATVVRSDAHITAVRFERSSLN
jgi:hypothetical protein